uniref:Uncharacterized protein n=1 Tax=Romanomermis culicivorax TaxID=13658 RepID=A0A915I540_ROMCU
MEELANGIFGPCFHATGKKSDPNPIVTNILLVGLLPHLPATTNMNVITQAMSKQLEGEHIQRIQADFK